MKKYLTILGYYIAIGAISTLVGTTLALYTPLPVLIPMIGIAVCGAAYIDYRRFFNNK